MAWAVFPAGFSYDRRPVQAVAFVVPASEQPQQWPRDVVEAAVASGKATEVKAPRRKTKA